MSETSSDDSTPDLTELRWIGPATAAELEAAGVDATDVTAKRVSYRSLVDTGVNPGVAAKIRREHSLSWSFEAGEGLESRSTQIRGLGRAEADWIAASAGDWVDESGADDAGSDADDRERTTEPVSDSGADPPVTSENDSGTDSGSGDWVPGDWPGLDDRSTEFVPAEAAWQERSRPTPVTDLEAVDDSGANLLSEAGITSIRSLATADPDHVADVLDVDVDRVSGWHEAARSASD
ncbi:hypothetical protein SAMN05192561_10682 [Halopenitus malekzadehii]|uniref:DUF7409 domain-containing protein n=1 Tax=Halopenitus malekzadehii TaxID=1267564 RepID=A0A1H6J8Y6_9EURY|nr:hypothetical protein [Halopenitus malekzadehii]SEH55417.1 hypothetical protein SAMN05192561_10682 [Halopenitus malekzadehii]